METNAIFDVALEIYNENIGCYIQNTNWSIISKPDVIEQNGFQI